MWNLSLNTDKKPNLVARILSIVGYICSDAAGIFVGYFAGLIMHYMGIGTYYAAFFSILIGGVVAAVLCFLVWFLCWLPGKISSRKKEGLIVS